MRASVPVWRPANSAVTSRSSASTSGSESDITRLRMLLTRLSTAGIKGRNSTRVLSGRNLTSVRWTDGVAGVMDAAFSGE